MLNKLKYIKRGIKYIIGTVVLAANFGSAAFGLNKDDNGYYLLGESAELKEFVVLVNSGKEPGAKGKITKDIEYNGGNVIDDGELSENFEYFEKWEPIGTNENPFQGELINDGEEVKRVTGIYINNKNDRQGFLGIVGEKGIIKGIEINFSYIKGEGFVGGIAGENFGKIINCIIGSDNIIKGGYNVGGNVGWNIGIIEQGCKNSGIVKGRTSIGGNVGCNKGTILGKCENSGKITGKTNVGGNVGENDAKNNIGIQSDGIIIGECNNKGDIKGEWYVGGNIGYNKGIATKEFDNEGVITGNGDVGGNVGWNNGSIETKCRNQGDITGEVKVGGYVGFNQGYINICEKERNYGKITGERKVGGNIGENEGRTEGYLLNKGEVKGKKDVGGVVGSSQGIMRGTQCNYGNILIVKNQ